MRVLVIGDLHFPFELDGYLQFCKKIQRKYKCTTVVQIGDIVDQHSITMHDKEPDAEGPSTELTMTRKKIKKMAKVFPKIHIAYGNHDLRIYRVAGAKAGIPRPFMRCIKDVYEMPDAWQLEEEWEFDNVIYEHGEGFSGMTGHRRAAIHHRQSTVIGHIHSFAGIAFMANTKELIFGMNVGCGIDRNAYAARYGKKMKNKPTVSCGVVINGRPYLEYMNLGSKVRRVK